MINIQGTGDNFRISFTDTGVTKQHTCRFDGACYGEICICPRICLKLDSEITAEDKMEIDEVRCFSDAPDSDGLDLDDSFQPCCECDLPDACSDFGCAIARGIKKDPRP